MFFGIVVNSFFNYGSVANNIFVTHNLVYSGIVVHNNFTYEMWLNLEFKTRSKQIPQTQSELGNPAYLTQGFSVCVGRLPYSYT